MNVVCTKIETFCIFTLSEYYRAILRTTAAVRKIDCCHLFDYEQQLYLNSLMLCHVLLSFWLLNSWIVSVVDGKCLVFEMRFIFVLAAVIVVSIYLCRQWMASPNFAACVDPPLNYFIAFHKTALHEYSLLYTIIQLACCHVTLEPLHYYSEEPTVTQTAQCNSITVRLWLSEFCTKKKTKILHT